MAQRSSTPQGRSRPTQAPSRVPNGQILPPRLEPFTIPCRPQSLAGAPTYLSMPTITCDDHGWNGASGVGDISMVNYPCATCECRSQARKKALLRALGPYCEPSHTSMAEAVSG